MNAPHSRASDGVNNIPSRLTYLRLHADSIFLSLLAVYSGASDLARPHNETIAIAVGPPVPPALLAWSAMLLVGGVLVGIGVGTRELRSELLGRAVIIIALTWSASRYAVVLGPFVGDTIEKYIVLAIVILICVMRASAILKPDTIYVVYPGRARPTSEDSELVLHGAADPATTTEESA